MRPKKVSPMRRGLKQLKAQGVNVEDLPKKVSPMRRGLKPALRELAGSDWFT